MRKKVKDLNETEFLALIESGKFRIKTEEELLEEGWEYAGCELEHEDEELLEEGWEHEDEELLEEGCELEHEDEDEELLEEGWEYAGRELEHEDEEVGIDVDILELSTPLTLSDIKEVDTSDSSFRVDLDCLTNCWFPMSIIEYSDFGIDPIVLDIPNEEDLLLV